MHFTNNRFTGVLTVQRPNGWYQFTVLYLGKNKHNSKTTGNSVGHIYFNSDGRIFFAYFSEFAFTVDEVLEHLQEELRHNGIKSFKTYVTVASNEVENYLKTLGVVNYLEMQNYT